jgi:NADH-quinone oxidoreductase subunit N
MWAPDVYEGAPTPITAFMATGVKIAGFVAIIRVFAFLDTPAQATLTAGAAVLAVLTMVVGNLGALPQNNIKRMLAFSSVAHAGYLLVGMAAGLCSKSSEAYQAIMYYLVAYTFMNVGAFGIIVFLKSKGKECNEIDDLAGLSQSHPGLALPMAIFMFTLAGIPPSAGFFGKFYLFKAAVDAGLIWLAVIAVLMSVVSLYYYLRVITTMYLKKPVGEAPEAEPCPYLATVALISVAGVLLLGIFPEDLLNLLGTVF